MGAAATSSVGPRASRSGLRAARPPLVGRTSTQPAPRPGRACSPWRACAPTSRRSRFTTRAAAPRTRGREIIGPSCAIRRVAVRAPDLAWIALVSANEVRSRSAPRLRAQVTLSTRAADRRRRPCRRASGTTRSSSPSTCSSSYRSTAPRRRGPGSCWCSPGPSCKTARMPSRAACSSAQPAAACSREPGPPPSARTPRRAPRRYRRRPHRARPRERR